VRTSNIILHYLNSARDVQHHGTFKAVSLVSKHLLQVELSTQLWGPSSLLSNGYQGLFLWG